MRLYYFSTYFRAGGAKGGSEYVEKDFQLHSLGFNLDVVLIAPKEEKVSIWRKIFNHIHLVLSIIWC